MRVWDGRGVNIVFEDVDVSWSATPYSEGLYWIIGEADSAPDAGTYEANFFLSELITNPPLLI